MTGLKNTFIIDTGADISIFKRGQVHLDQIVNISAASKIKGVTEGLVSSLGVTKTNIMIDNYEIPHFFHIVENSFPIPGDGILGRDFLVKHKSFIDYGDWTMTLRLPHTDLVIPIFNGPEENTLYIPPRCEVIRHIKCLENIKQDSLIENKELQPGIYIARTIISKENPIVKIINTTLESARINITSLQTMDLDQFQVFNIETEPQCRESQLLSELNQNIPEFVKNDMLSLCKEFSDVFALQTDKLTVNNFYKQKLKLLDNTPKYIKNYRMPHVLKKEMNKQVGKMLHNNVIEPSASEYNSPVLLVPKKSTDGQKAWRMCIDFRNVNKALLADKFPLPRIDDILDQLGRAKWFSVVDLMSGFHQIPLDEASRDITSFSVDSGSYRFTRLPFGLSVSPNSFQRMMSIAFAGITPEKAFLYMDDLIVIGCSEKHHLANLKEVFETCRRCNLKLNPQKCNFFRKEVTYLGHKITDKGILPDDSKYQIINKYPTPQSADEVKRFVAFCNYYRRFIPYFASVTNPLNKLTRKNADFTWSLECEKSFNYLKNALISPKILQYPDFSKKFVLTTDASKDSCGAVLAQNFEGQELPIAYASRAFTKGEINKSTILKELSAIHWAIKHFRCYLYGQKFLVKSDHRPLVYLFSMKDPSSKLTRMRLDLEEFDFDIEYIKGKDNVGADALSRINIENLKEIHDNAYQVLAVTRSMSRSVEDDNDKDSLIKDLNLHTDLQPKIFEAINNYEVLNLPLLKFELSNTYVKMSINYKKKIIKHATLRIINDNIALEQILSKLKTMADDCRFSKLRLNLNDIIFSRCTVNDIKKVGQKTLDNLTIVLSTPQKVITDNSEKIKLIKRFHDDPMLGGHCGQKRLLKKLKAFYRWKNMSRDIAKYTRECHKCQINKIQSRHIEPLILTPTPQKAFDITCIDTIGPFQKSNSGNAYAVTIQCELTKYVIIAPIPNKEAVTVAKAIFENFILIYGTTKEIRTDMGTEYKNELFKNLAILLKMQHNTSTAYHSQTIGGCERNHRVLNEFLRMYINETRSDWDMWMKYFAFCYNTTPSTYHNYTPFELVFGKRANLSELFTESRIDPLYNIDAYDQEVRYRLQLAHKRTRAYLERAKRQRKEHFDITSREMILNPGDLVLVTNEDRHKLDSWFDGPFSVVSTEGANCIVSDGSSKQYKIHKNRLKKYATSS